MMVLNQMKKEKKNKEKKPKLDIKGHDGSFWMQKKKGQKTSTGDP